MHAAFELTDGPRPVSGTSLDPYGQLIRMLLPRAQAIVFYDRLGSCIWESDGMAGPDLQAVMHEALQGELHGRSSRGEGFADPLSREQTAYVFLLRDDSRQLIGSVGIVSRDVNGESRPFSLLQGLLRPALECLGRELAAQSSIGDLQRSLLMRDGDLELLIGRAGDEDGSADNTDDFGHILQGCVDHLGCLVGALLIPEKNIVVCRTVAGTPASLGTELLTRTHRHLIGWTQLQRQTMISNAVTASGPLPNLEYKVLLCPVMHGAQRVMGALTLFKRLDAPDFDLRQVRLVELLARRVAHILLNAYDPATGLLTRTAFEKRAHAALSDPQHRGGHCVVYADIDRLHVHNENLGMHVGDEIIVRAAEAMRRHVSARMLAARISGDRFALLLPDGNVERAQEFAETLQAALQLINFVSGNQPIDITMSFGIAQAGEGPHALSHALASAEIACKAAKDRGRDRVEVYAAADQSIMRRYTDITLIGTVRSALIDQRFQLEAQAIVPLNGARASPKFELLLRMTDEDGKSVTPDRFFSAAERYQLAPAIDRWVLRRTLELLKPAAPRLRDLGACFAVNISGQSLGDAEFAAFMDSTLRDSGVPLELVSFELTETAAVANIVRAEAMIRRLRDLGCAVALDDFGRGLSSLTYLKTLPVNFLKIDGSFVRDVVSDQRSHAMLSAIVQLARAMGLKTVAECVESEDIRQVVRTLGVDYGQGYAIGRPVPIDKVLAVLAAANMPVRAVS